MCCIKTIFLKKDFILQQISNKDGEKNSKNLTILIFDREWSSFADIGNYMIHSGMAGNVTETKKISLV